VGDTPEMAVGAAGGEGVIGASPASDPEGAYARVAAVGLIRSEDDGRWLMLRSTHPEWFTRPSGPVLQELWGPPGGRLEHGEDLETALRREIREETGLEVEVAGPVYAYLTVHKGERLLSVSMACRVASARGDVRVDHVEADDFRWITSQEWLEWAEAGRTPWEPDDVRRVTAMAAVLWDVVDSKG
jgi:ADP-ribose pyrophosphatase YjhB (NUDIX family)